MPRISTSGPWLRPPSMKVSSSGGISLFHQPPWQPQRLQLQQQHRTKFHSKAPIRPYSDSLPSPGYEWCTRCEIRTHRFQKPIDCHNSCLDTPRLFGWGVCGPARQYYQQQLSQMIFLSLFCFAVAPMVNATQTQQDDDDEDQ